MGRLLVTRTLLVEVLGGKGGHCTGIFFPFGTLLVVVGF